MFHLIVIHLITWNITTATYWPRNRTNKWNYQRAASKWVVKKIRLWVSFVIVMLCDLKMEIERKKNQTTNDIIWGDVASNHCFRNGMSFLFDDFWFTFHWLGFVFLFEFHLRDYEAELESGPGNGEQRLVGGGGGAAAPADRRRGRRGDFLRHFDADLARLVRPQDDGGVETGQRRHLTALVFGQEHLDRVGRTRRRLVCVTKKKATWSMIESVETVATPRGTEFSWLPTFLKWLGKVSSGSLGIEMIRCVTRKCGHGRTMLLLLLFFLASKFKNKKEHSQWMELFATWVGKYPRGIHWQRRFLFVGFTDRPRLLDK